MDTATTSRSTTTATTESSYGEPSRTVSASAMVPTTEEEHAQKKLPWWKKILEKPRSAEGRQEKMKRDRRRAEIKRILEEEGRARRERTEDLRMAKESMNRRRKAPAVSTTTTTTMESQAMHDETVAERRGEEEGGGVEKRRSVLSSIKRMGKGKEKDRETLLGKEEEVSTPRITEPEPRLRRTFPGEVQEEPVREPVRETMREPEERQPTQMESRDTLGSVSSGTMTESTTGTAAERRVAHPAAEEQTLASYALEEERPYVETLHEGEYTPQAEADRPVSHESHTHSHHETTGPEDVTEPRVIREYQRELDEEADEGGAGMDQKARAMEHERVKRTPAQAIGTARQEIGGAPVVDPHTPGAVPVGDKWIAVNPEGFLKQQFEERQAAGLARPQEEVGKEIRDELESLREREAREAMEKAEGKKEEGVTPPPDAGTY